MSRKIYKIGDHIKDSERDFILTRKYSDLSSTKYQYKCNICGYDCNQVGYKRGKEISETWFFSSQIARKDKCSCCSNKIIIPDINSIYATNKELLPYFKDVKDSKKYSLKSNDKIIFKCPDCGTEKEMIIANFSKRGFCCPCCSDKISIGEKIIYCLLDYLKIDFIKETTSNILPWSESFRYDFYIYELNTIIEVNGKQHYDGNGFSYYKNAKTVEQEKENDKNKYNLAIINGVKNYIVIDASNSSFDFIIESILSSPLAKLFDLSSVDWNEIISKTMNSLVKSVCFDWNNYENITLSELSKKYHIHKSTIRKYLKIGNQLNWCKFDKLVSKTKHYDNPNFNDAPNSSRPIYCKTINSYFKSVGLCSKNSEKLFHRYIGASTIRFLLSGKETKFKKINIDFEYITKQEFNKAIENGCECYGTPYKL